MNALPANLGLPWWLIEFTLSLTATVIAIFLWSGLTRFLRKKSEKTTNPWDDILARSTHLPVTVLILLIGFIKILKPLVIALLDISAYRVLKLSETLTSTTILITLFWIFFRTLSNIESLYRRRHLTIGGHKIDRSALGLIFRIARAAIFLAGGLIVLKDFGVSLTGLLAFGGMGGIIVGFATKDTLANFFSGLLITWERPFIVGDWIRHPQANIEGIVENIGWRMTQIRSFDMRPLYVPNSLFFNSVIENPQRMTSYRIYERFGLRYRDIAALPVLLEDIRTLLKTDDGIDNRQVIMVNFDRYGASSLECFIYAMTTTTDWQVFHHIKERLLVEIAQLIHKHECQFAPPRPHPPHRTPHRRPLPHRPPRPNDPPHPPPTSPRRHHPNPHPGKNPPPHPPSSASP